MLHSAASHALVIGPQGAGKRGARRLAACIHQLEYCELSSWSDDVTLLEGTRRFVVACGSDDHSGVVAVDESPLDCDDAADVMHEIMSGMQRDCLLGGSGVAATARCSVANDHSQKRNDGDAMQCSAFMKRGSQQPARRRACKG